MNRTIVLCGRPISYVLTYKRVKNINLRVRDDGTVGISAPQGVSVEQVEGILRKRETFLLQAMDKFQELEELAPKTRTYTDGEVWYLLGRPYRLTVEAGKENALWEEGETLHMQVRDPGSLALREKTFRAWQKARCAQICETVCRSVYPSFQAQGVAFPEIRVRFLTSRWGSCKPKAGLLTFSSQLAEAPLPCVEYVVCHEFTHFLHPDHSKAFYAALERVLPDWKERRRLLNTYGYRQSPPLPENTAGEASTPGEGEA